MPQPSPAQPHPWQPDPLTQNLQPVPAQPSSQNFQVININAPQSCKVRLLWIKFFQIAFNKDIGQILVR